MNSPLALITHTPPAVWAVLAVLVLVGLRQMRTQRVPAGRVWIVPLVAAAASLGGALQAFGAAGDVLTVACWAAGAALGFVSNRALDLPRRVSANADGSFTVGGSAAPLLLYLGIFAVRYVSGAALAIQPALAHAPGAAAAAGVAYGFSVGLLAARSRKVLASRRALAAPAAA